MREMRASLPGAVVSGDYPEMLEAAGFQVLIDRTVPIRFDAPLDHRARQLALGYLTRMRQHVEPYADAADLAVLDRLVHESDPGGILHRHGIAGEGDHARAQRLVRLGKRRGLQGLVGHGGLRLTFAQTRAGDPLSCTGATAQTSHDCTASGTRA
jgi:hypothetical protein